MKPDNDHLVARGVVTVKGRQFPAGRPFPAADLGIDPRSFDSLLRAGTLVSAKTHAVREHTGDDRLEHYPRRRLVERAHELGITGAEKLSRDNIISEIRARLK